MCYTVPSSWGLIFERRQSFIVINFYLFSINQITLQNLGNIRADSLVRENDRRTTIYQSSNHKNKMKMREVVGNIFKKQKTKLMLPKWGYRCAHRVVIFENLPSIPHFSTVEKLMDHVFFPRRFISLIYIVSPNLSELSTFKFKPQSSPLITPLIKPREVWTWEKKKQEIGS